jgi:hypothetical protein
VQEELVMRVVAFGAAAIDVEAVAEANLFPEVSIAAAQAPPIEGLPRG